MGWSVWTDALTSGALFANKQALLETHLPSNTSPAFPFLCLTGFLPKELCVWKTPSRWVWEA